MTDNERMVLELQDEMRNHSETINKILVKYKNNIDEYLIKGMDIKTDFFSGIENQCKIIEEISIHNRTEQMRIKHKMLMKPAYRLSHLFVLLDDKTLSEILDFNFGKEKENFLKNCKMSNIEYSIQNFPDKKMPFALKEDIKVYTDEDIKCEYIIQYKGAVITQCLEYYKPNISIPKKILGYDVRVIGPKAFYQCDEIISVKLPSTVSIIGYYAFGECKRLRCINGWNIKSRFKVENRAFWKTDIRRIDMSVKQVKFIARDVFEGCRFLLSINIYGTNLGKNSFASYFNVGKQCSINVYQD